MSRAMASRKAVTVTPASSAVSRQTAWAPSVTSAWSTRVSLMGPSVRGPAGRRAGGPDSLLPVGAAPCGTGHRMAVTPARYNSAVDPHADLPHHLAPLLPPRLGDGSGVLPPGSGISSDAARGALIGGAVGDALGRPAEGCDPVLVAARFGVLRDYRPWGGWVGGPVGTITDDTQMTMCVAEWLAEAGDEPDPAALAERFQRWLPVGRGVGSTCRRAVERLDAGLPWHQAGVASAGNGAAMRVAPVGLACHDDLDRLRRVAALSAVVTHADPTAVASAIAQAFLVAWLARRDPHTLRVDDVLDALGAVLTDVEHPPVAERKPGGGRVRLRERLLEVGDWLDAPAGDAFEHFYNGAFVLESLPAALWCFLRSPDDAEEVIIAAANGGHDADTVAAMAGALVGAYLGESALPNRWTGPDLEYADELRGLADRL